MSGFPLDPLTQYNPKQLANLTASTGVSSAYLDRAPNIDIPPVGTDASSLIPKLFGYLSGSYDPIETGNSTAQITQDGYFGPALPRPGGPMPPFPPPSGAGGSGIGANSNTNYGQPSIKNNAAPGSLILTYSVNESPTDPSAWVVEEISQSELVTAAQNIPWVDEVTTQEINLPV